MSSAITEGAWSGTGLPPPPGKSAVMENYDLYVERVRAFVEDLRGSGRRIRQFDAGDDPQRLLEGLPVRVGQRAHSGLILRRETFAELGNPDAGSCAFPLWTRRPSLIDDGRITLIGADIQESEGASLPFGQVVMVGGKDLSGEDQLALEQTQFVADQIEGYMIRSAPGRVWSRVSRSAANKGFDLRALGVALLTIFKSKVPKVEAMEILFVTTARSDVHQLDEMAEQVRALGTRFVKQAWLAKGFDPDECSVTHDCASCAEKPGCDDVREIVKLRKEIKK